MLVRISRSILGKREQADIGFRMCRLRARYGWQVVLNDRKFCPCLRFRLLRRDRLISVESHSRQTQHASMMMREDAAGYLQARKRCWRNVT